MADAKTENGVIPETDGKRPPGPAVTRKIRWHLWEYPIVPAILRKWLMIIRRLSAVAGSQGTMAARKFGWQRSGSKEAATGWKTVELRTHPGSQFPYGATVHSIEFVIHSENRDFWKWEQKLEKS